MKIKTSELKDTALDWAVAKCEGFVQDDDPAWERGYEPFGFSTDWAQGGPIIERERISLEYLSGAGDAGMDVWVATRAEGPCISEEQADKPLVAAMRCFVASKLGDEVDVPEELKGEEA